MAQANNKNWWERNWKWFIPVGCLGALTLFVGFIALILSLVYGMIKSSDAYKDALVIAKTNPSVQKTIGAPIEEGFFTSGNINLSGSSGRADLSIPIYGPEGKAKIYVIAVKTAGAWTFSTLVVEIKNTGERIDLMHQKSMSNHSSEPTRITPADGGGD